jgi:hypothetical protein
MKLMDVIQFTGGRNQWFSVNISKKSNWECTFFWVTWLGLLIFSSLYCNCTKVPCYALYATPWLGTFGTLLTDLYCNAIHLSVTKLIKFTGRCDVEQHCTYQTSECMMMRFYIALVSAYFAKCRICWFDVTCDCFCH